MENRSSCRQTYKVPWYIVFTSIDMKGTRPVGIQRHVERGHLHLASPKIENSSLSSHAKPQSCWQHRIASDSSQQLSNFCGSFHSIDSPLNPFNNSSFLLAPCIDTVDCHSFLFLADLTRLGGVQISLHFGSVPASRPSSLNFHPQRHTPNIKSEHLLRAASWSFVLRAGIVVQVSCILTCEHWTTLGYANLLGAGPAASNV